MPLYQLPSLKTFEISIYFYTVDDVGGIDDTRRPWSVTK